MVNFSIHVDVFDNVEVSEFRKKRGVAEQYYKREADWKEAGEKAPANERAWMLSDNISGTSDSSELLVLSPIS